MKERVINLKDNRALYGIKRSELAREAGMSHDMLYRWETGRRAPTLHSAVKVYDAFLRLTGHDIGLYTLFYDHLDG